MTPFVAKCQALLAIITDPTQAEQVRESAKRELAQVLQRAQLPADFQRKAANDE